MTLATANFSAAHLPSGFAQAVAKAIADYRASIRSYPLWTLLAWLEIKVKYKRSFLGPLWITLSTGISIATIGPIYSKLMGASMTDYFAYLATSIVLWNFIAGVINDAGNALITSEGILKDTKMPFAMFIFKEIYRNLLLLAHNSVILLILMLFFPFNVNILLFAVSTVVICLNLFWVGLALAILCLRFRDIGQIVASIVQVAFFITPIMWSPQHLGGRHFVIDFNPFYYLIELFRSPLLNANIDLGVLAICVASAIIGNVAVFFFFAAKRARVTYWM
jgi:ABC-type polysaccharide/polyol phosphate export permease